MILTDGMVTNPRSDKYDSPMAVYLESLWCRGDSGDDWVGNVEWSGGHNVRYGRRIMVSDNYGFVSVLTFSTEGQAKDFMDDLYRQYEQG